MNGIDHILHYLDSGVRQFPEGAVRPVLVVMLGFTFLWSGIAKMRSPWGTAFALVDFRVLKRPSILFAWGLAIGEIVLAFLLVIAPAVSTGFAVAVTGVTACVFIAFSAFIAQALRSHRRFECACFGSGGQELSGKTLVRSAALGAIAIVAGIAGSLGTPLTLSELALTWCAAASLLGIGLLLTCSRKLVQLPRPWEVGA